MIDDSFSKDAHKALIADLESKEKPLKNLTKRYNFTIDSVIITSELKDGETLFTYDMNVTPYKNNSPIKNLSFTGTKKGDIKSGYIIEAVVPLYEQKEVYDPVMPVGNGSVCLDDIAPNRIFYIPREPSSYEKVIKMATLISKDDLFPKDYFFSEVIKLD